MREQVWKSLKAKLFLIYLKGSGIGDDVEVGFTLVQQAAMRPSDEEEYSTTTSGTYSSETYTSSSFDEESEEISDDGRSYTRSRSLDDRVSCKELKNLSRIRIFGSVTGRNSLFPTLEMFLNSILSAK